MIRFLAFALILCSSSAVGENCTLLTKASSKMRDGAAFSCIADSGKTHKGVLVTKRAKNFFRRGTLMFRFDEPLAVVGSSEGRFKASRKMQAITLGAALSAAKIADDSVEGAIGAGKARYVGLGAAMIAMFCLRGGDVTLKPGDTLQIAGTR
jgi:hypothetical protein